MVASTGELQHRTHLYGCRPKSLLSSASLDLPLRVLFCLMKDVYLHRAGSVSLQPNADAQKQC